VERDLGPLEEIEQSVQERAKDISLEMTGGGKDKLRALIADEVARWSLDHRRGLRPYDLSEPDLVAERAFRNLAGYGPLEPLLADDDVWEVMVNAPDAIFVKRHRGRSGYHDEVFHDDEHVIRTLTKILDDATGSHRKLDASEGLQDAQLDDGARLHIVHGDISVGRGSRHQPRELQARRNAVPPRRCGCDGRSPAHLSQEVDDPQICDDLDDVGELELRREATTAPAPADGVVVGVPDIAGDQDPVVPAGNVARLADVLGAGRVEAGEVGHDAVLPRCSSSWRRSAGVVPPQTPFCVSPSARPSARQSWRTVQRAHTASASATLEAS